MQLSPEERKKLLERLEALDWNNPEEAAKLLAELVRKEEAAEQNAKERKRGFPYTKQ